MLFPDQEIKTKSGSKIILRPPQESEALKVLDLFIQITETSPYILSTPEVARQMSLEAQIKRIQNLNENPNQVCILAESESQLIGMADFTAYKDIKRRHRGSVGISVLPAFRGQGLGQQMMVLLIQLIKSTELIKSIELNVMGDNTSAYLLYKQLGFVETGRTPYGNQLQPGQYTDDICMQMWIGS